MPELTDYLRASDGNGESVRCIVVADRGVGDLVFNNTTPTNWHTYFIAMAGTVDPVTDRFIEGEYIVFKGHLDGSAITIDELAPGYVDNGNQEDDIIVIKPTTLWADIVADTMDTVTQAIIDADAATAAANAAASSATTAAGNANTATTAANAATSAANTATTNANTATTNANAATSSANTAATNATNAANATSWTQGTAVPTGGYNGNFYLRTTTYDVYQKIAGTWTIIANIQGATGSTGAPGAVWRSGAGAPSSGLGINGDYYINTTNSDVYFKASGTYSVVVNIKGATGATGANGSTWYNGSGAPSAGTGVNGDFYWDYTNYKVYTKSGGSWSLLSTISANDANAIKIDGSATVTANIPFNAKKLTGVADPTSAQDAATKNYIDGRTSAGVVDANGWYKENLGGTLKYYKTFTPSVSSTGAAWLIQNQALPVDIVSAGTANTNVQMSVLFPNNAYSGHPNIEQYGSGTIGITYTFSGSAGTANVWVEITKYL